MRRAIVVGTSLGMMFVLGVLLEHATTHTTIKYEVCPRPEYPMGSA